LNAIYFSHLRPIFSAFAKRAPFGLFFLLDEDNSGAPESTIAMIKVNITISNG
jgi:hypothetical protein